MPQEKSHVYIEQLLGSVGSSSVATVSVAFRDGTMGTINLPKELVGLLIEHLHIATLGRLRDFSVPEIEVLGLGVARNHDGTVLLRMSTSNAHVISCTLLRKQSDLIVKSLSNVNSLPLIPRSSLN
jgi:hypothetical protein